MTDGSKLDTVSQVTNAVWNMTGLNLAGLLVIIVFSVFNTDTASDRFRAAAVGLLVAVATCLVGALMGFVFGIPRTLQKLPSRSSTKQTFVETTSTAGQQARPDALTSVKATYRANTNLERISDWLATVIVGVGLTQLSQLPGKVQSLAEFVSPGLGNTPYGTVAAAAIVVYYGIGGFLLGYLWTRLYFWRALTAAEGG